MEVSCLLKLRKCKTNRKYTQFWLSPNSGISVAIFLHILCLQDIQDIYHAQHCKTHKFFRASKSLCSVTKCHCLLGYFHRAHLNKCDSHHHETLILFHNIVRSIIFIDMLHSYFTAWLQHSPLSVETCSAWLLMKVTLQLDVQSNVGFKPPERYESWHILHSLRVARLLPSLHDCAHLYTSASYCMIHEPEYLGTSLIPY